MKKNNKIWRKIWLIGLLAILVTSIIYFLFSYGQLKYSSINEGFSEIDSKDVVGELVDGSIVKQSYVTDADYIKGIEIKFANYGHIAKGSANITVTNSSTVLVSQEVDISLLPDNDYYYVNFNGLKSISDSDKKIEVTIEVNDAKEGSTITLWDGDKKAGTELIVNGKEVDATLVMTPDAYIYSGYAMKYFIFIGCLLLLWSIYSIYEIRCEENGKRNFGIEFAHIFDDYKFLLKQLVSKDFKTKYRRSYLGILWSLLSPVFMMIIVSSVFSFIFRFDIEHFQVYLILGQITFSVFSEATQVAENTITGAGQLIKKVYLPKYIFPLSKVTFSFVNFWLCLIPAFLVIFYYRVPLTINVVYLPLWFVEYYTFTLGLGMLLAAATVFFRDLQHLYSLVVLAWGYVTPLFYPVSSLSPSMRMIMNFNPLYHYITYLRDILLYGYCPSLKLQIVCVILAVLSFAIGSHYFYKRQNKFILYI